MRFEKKWECINRFLWDLFFGFLVRFAFSSLDGGKEKNQRKYLWDERKRKQEGKGSDLLFWHLELSPHHVSWLPLNIDAMTPDGDEVGEGKTAVAERDIFYGAPSAVRSDSRRHRVYVEVELVEQGPSCNRGLSHRSRKQSRSKKDSTASVDQSWFRHKQTKNPNNKTFSTEEIVHHREEDSLDLNIFCKQTSSLAEVWNCSS